MPLSGEQGERHGDETEEQRPLDPERRPDPQQEDGDAEPWDQAVCRRRQLPHEAGEHGAEHAVGDHQPAEPTGVVDDGVEHRREPALHDPRLAGRGERVRIVRRDRVTAEDQPPGGQVGEEAVVVERAQPDEQAGEDDDRARTSRETRVAAAAPHGAVD